MATVYFAQRDETTGELGKASSRLPKKDIPTEEINQAFPNCAQRVELPEIAELETSADPPEGFQDGKFVTVVVDVREQEMGGQFDSPGHWLLDSVGTDDFVAAFRQHYPDSILQRELDQKRQKAKDEMRKQRFGAI